MSSEDGANSEANPSFLTQAAENAHGGAPSNSITAATGCGDALPRDLPWDPWSLLQSQCSPRSTGEFPRPDGLMHDGHTYSRDLHQSHATKNNPPSVVDNSINSVNLDTRTHRDNLPLLDPTAVFEQHNSPGCSTKLGPREYYVVQPKAQSTSEKSRSSDLPPAQCSDDEIRNPLSVRYPFEIFSEENTSKNDIKEEEELNRLLSKNKRSDTYEKPRHNKRIRKFLDDTSETKTQQVSASLPCHGKCLINKNNTIPVLETKEKLSKVTNNLNNPNSDRQQTKASQLPVFQKLVQPHDKITIGSSCSDFEYKHPLFQSVHRTEGLRSTIENSKSNSENNCRTTSNCQTNPFKNSSCNPDSTTASDVGHCSNQASPTAASTNYESGRLQHQSTDVGKLGSKTRNAKQSKEPVPTNNHEAKPAPQLRNTDSTLHKHTSLSPAAQSASTQPTELSGVSKSSPPPTPSSADDKCCQDKRCSSSRPHPNTGTAVVAESAAVHALYRNTVQASSSSALQGMAGQNHHHLSRTVLDESAPRVPVHPPPLDNSDVMRVPERDVDDLLFQDQQRTSSLSTSFADLMLGDHTSMRHKGRDGRLGRCGEGRDSRLYGLSEAATIASLRETVLALQLQNTQLSLCLQQERSRREQAENLVDQEKGYIKRLEDTIQTLKSTRLVIDPNMYRQIAESYIASRKTPVRRTCSSSQQRPGHYEDLVCDSSPDNSLSNSPTSPNSTSSSQFLVNDAKRQGGSNPTYTHAPSTCANDTLAMLPPIPSTSKSRLPSQSSIFNVPQDLRWPSERVVETSLSPTDDYLFRENRSASNSRKDTIPKRRDV